MPINLYRKGLFMSIAATLSILNQTSGADALRFKGMIERFAAESVQQPPPDRPILLVGSSSFTRWRTAAAELGRDDILNRGFGGSQMAHVLYWFDQVVRPYNPRQILVYEGDNDIWRGKTPSETEADFRTFIARAREAFPAVPILLLLVKPSPARMDKRMAYEALNQRLRDLAAEISGVDFADTWSPMLDADGCPRAELYVRDGVHLSPAGYAVWVEVLRPKLIDL